MKVYKNEKTKEKAERVFEKAVLLAILWFFMKKLNLMFRVIFGLMLFALVVKWLITTSMTNLNPESHFGKLLFSYYGTYDVNEIADQSSETDPDYIPPEPKKRKPYNCVSKEARNLY